MEGNLFLKIVYTINSHSASDQVRFMVNNCWRINRSMTILLNTSAELELRIANKEPGGVGFFLGGGGLVLKLLIVKKPNISSQNLSALLKNKSCRKEKCLFKECTHFHYNLYLTFASQHFAKNSTYSSF